MEALKKLLFGRKVYFDDPILGRFETRVKSANPSIESTWYGGNQLSGYKAETTLIIEGNLNGPNKHDLQSIKRIISELSEIISKIDSELSSRPNYSKILNWSTTLFLGAVISSEEGFEIVFESENFDDNRTVSCIWNNGRITEIEGE